MATKNFGPIWAKLTAKDREICVRAVLLHFEGTRKFESWYAALLPFTKYSDVRDSLDCGACAGDFYMENQRVLKKCRLIRKGLRLWVK